MSTPTQDGAPDEHIGHGLQTYSDVLQGAGGAQLRAQMRRGGESTVCAALYAAPPYDLRVPPMQVSRLSLNLTPAHVVGGIEGERPRGHDASRFSLFLAPAGGEMAWRKEAPSRHLTIYFRPDLFADSGEPPSPLGQLQALNNLTVPGLRPLAEQLVDELRQGELHSAEAVDGLARLMLIHVSRHLVRAREEPAALGSLAMARLKDYLMAHLGERILVADMARQVALSADRFAWTFKAQTGQAPHQFMMALRLEQARHLLRASQLPIADIAHACGFASQQHLTNSMRRSDGTTPACYRRSRSPGLPEDALG